MSDSDKKALDEFMRQSEDQGSSTKQKNAAAKIKPTLFV